MSLRKVPGKVSAFESNARRKIINEMLYDMNSIKEEKGEKKIKTCLKTYILKI